jgi:hypothetical protein
MPNNPIYYKSDKTGKATKSAFYLTSEQAKIMKAAADKMEMPEGLRKAFYMTPFAEAGITTTIDGTQVFTPNNSAESTKDAVGPFQFIKSTADMLGLKDRTDFRQSAFASAKYMRNNYDLAVIRGEENPADAASVYYNRGPRDSYNTGKKTDRVLPKETRQYLTRKHMNNEGISLFMNEALGIQDTDPTEGNEGVLYNNNTKTSKPSSSYTGTSFAFDGDKDKSKDKSGSGTSDETEEVEEVREPPKPTAKELSQGFSSNEDDGMWQNPIYDQIQERNFLDTVGSQYKHGGNVNRKASRADKYAKVRSRNNAIALNRSSKYLKDGGDVNVDPSADAAGESGLAKSIPYLESIPKVINGVSQLRDGDKSNDGKAIGSLIGTAVDTAALAFGIPTMGMGEKLGSATGGVVDDNKATPLDMTQFYKQESFKRGGNANGMNLKSKLNKIDNPKRATIEIEKDEYVFNPAGINEATFKMLNSTGTDSKSSVGFLAKGASHEKGGIGVIEGKAYIASSHLGVDGKKSSKKNMSVAKTILKEGGEVLAQSSDYDKFSVSKKYTPNAYSHVLNNMQKVADKAEHNKNIEESIKNINTDMNNYRSAYKKGGHIKQGYDYAGTNNQMISQGIKDAYMYRNGGNTGSALNMSYDEDLLQYMNDGGMAGMPPEGMGEMPPEQGMPPEEGMGQESVMDQIPPEQQEQVMQLAEAAMQGDEAAMQQLVEMLGEEGVQMLMQELEQGGGQGGGNPSNEAAQQAMGQMPGGPAAGGMPPMGAPPMGGGEMGGGAPPMMRMGGKLSNRYNRY